MALPSPTPTHATLAVLLALAFALAGCAGPEDGAGLGETPEPTATLLISLLPVDKPDGYDSVQVDVRIQHLALFDNETEEWRPLLDDPASASLRFEPGIGDPVLLATVDITEREYMGIEVVVADAEVTAAGNRTDATIPEVACFAPVSFGAFPAGETFELELWVSGAAALEQNGTAWTFRPALIATHSANADREVQISEPDCRPR